MSSRHNRVVAPMAVIAPLFAVGIVVARWCDSVTLFVWVAVLAVSLLVGVLSVKVRAVAVVVGVFALGGATMTLHQMGERPPLDSTINAVVELSSVSEPTPWGELRADAKIVEWSDKVGVTYPCNRSIKATYRADSALCVGTRCRCSVQIRPMHQNRYAQLMYVRGFDGYGRLENCRVEGRRTSLRSRAVEVQAAAVERLGRLMLAEDVRTVAEAMVLGYRRDVSRSIREDYASTGSSHLLAVSGLHVGIVFILVNLVLCLLPFVRYGHILKNIAAIVLIWAFTFVSGLSPSAVRAATMFSAVQIGLATSRANHTLNVICAAALLMLTVCPWYLFDISFQLSFAAVLGITLWFPLVYGWLSSESRLLNVLWSVIIVGGCATIAVLPLTAYAFGRVSIVGVLLGPVVVALAHVTLVCGVLWCAVPLEAFRGVAQSILTKSVGWQNDIVGATARLPLSSIEWNPSGKTVAMIYVALLILTVALWRMVPTTKSSDKILFE